MKHFLQYFTELSLHPKNAEELKGLILQLAVQGKLTAKWREENPDVEPASVLLKRIQTEKAQLVKEKKIKKEKALPKISDEEIPFELPESWAWCRLGNYAHYGSLSKCENDDVDNNTWILELEDVEKGSSKLLQKVRCKERFFKSTKNVFRKHDVVYGKLRPYLDKVIVADEDGICTTEMIPIKSFCQSDSEFLRLYLKSPRFIEYANESTHGMHMPRMGTDVAKKAVISVPPFEEQKAIVKTVNQLFTEVEQLETLTKERIQLKEDFVTSALHQLHTGDTATEWAFLQQHFSTFFTEESNIKKLRESILQLAVQGKLTHHWRKENPEVEPASVLLERIQEEKAQLVKAKKIKKEKPLPEITEEEMPYDLPEGWVWARAADLCSPRSIITYGILKPVWITGGVPTVRIKDMKNGSISLKEIACCTLDRAAKFKKTTLLEGDLLIAKDGGTLGKTAFVPKELEGGNITQHVLRFSISDELSNEFIRATIDSPYGQNYMKGETKGAALPGVNVGDFRKMPIGTPPYDEQKAIAEKVNILMSLCDQLAQAIQTSKATQEDWMKSSLREVFEREVTY